MNSETAIRRRRRPHHGGNGQAAVPPRPPVERSRVAQDGEVVDGDDHGNGAPQRAAEGRAVQDVEALPPGPARKPDGIPEHVARDRGEPAGPAEAEPHVLVPLQQGPDVPGRAGPGLDERRDVEADADHCRPSIAENASSIARPVAASETGRVGEAARDELLPPPQRLLQPGGDRVGAVRVGPHGGLAGRLVQRRVRRGDHGHAARHRLDDRDPEPLEARRVDERRRPAVEAARARRRRRSRAGSRRDGRAPAAAPQPAAPTTASACPSGRRAASSVSRFLRGSSVATVST